MSQNKRHAKREGQKCGIELAEREKARDNDPGPLPYDAAGVDHWPNQLKRQINSVEIVWVYFLESMPNPAAPVIGTFAQSKLE